MNKFIHSLVQRTSLVKIMQVEFVMIQTTEEKQTVRKKEKKKYKLWERKEERNRNCETAWMNKWMNECIFWKKK